MNKKVMYAALAFLLVLVIVIVAIVAFGGNKTKNDSDKNPVSSTDSVTTESTNGTFDDVEEEPIIADKDDASGKRPNNIVSSEKTEVSNKNESSSKPQTNSKPSESKSTDSSASEEKPSDIDTAEYEEFLKMTASEQQKYVNSFSNIDAFFDWYNAAKKAYEQANPPIEVGDGEINIGDIIEEKD